MNHRRGGDWRVLVKVGPPFPQICTDTLKLRHESPRRKPSARSTRLATLAQNRLCSCCIPRAAKTSSQQRCGSHLAYGVSKRGVLLIYQWWREQEKLARHRQAGTPVPLIPRPSRTRVEKRNEDRKQKTSFCLVSFLISRFSFLDCQLSLARQFCLTNRHQSQLVRAAAMITWLEACRAQRAQTKAR